MLEELTVSTCREEADGSSKTLVFLVEVEVQLYTSFNLSARWEMGG